MTTDMSAGEKLRPCPYCGSANVEMKRYHGLYGVECNDCFRPSWMYYTTLKAAVVRWNSGGCPDHGDRG